MPKSWLFSPLEQLGESVWLEIDFLPSEMVAIRKALEPEERKEADGVAAEAEPEKYGPLVEETDKGLRALAEAVVESVPNARPCPSKLPNLPELDDCWRLFDFPRPFSELLYSDPVQPRRGGSF